ncbi:LAETG motif-containing sortase-dependent surface protein [Streptomyces sp. NPDC059816]|uniref:LAETG motif-containing sortase-dependent surface protein n=1 Tax=Streptomyces sp. NPDC059816 TaxID=3346960 RepID=UPI00364968E1
MKQTTRAWQRSGVLVAGTAVGLLGVGLAAAPATAHTPVWSVTCSEVTVDLTDYADDEKVTNTVTITADGKDVLPTKKFGKTFSDRLTLPEHTAEIEVRLVVKAGDGKQFDVDETKTAPVCASPSPSGSPEPSGSSKPSPTPTVTTSTSAEPTEPGSSESARPSQPPASAEPTEPEGSDSARPAPRTSEPADEDLAATGGSSTTPWIAGAAVLVLLAGGGIVFAARKRRTPRG